MSAEGKQAVDRYNVVWESPSEDSSGSMPLGNGEIGLNVWVESDGLYFYIARTDAWSENCRLLKLGRVRVRFAPDPFGEGRRFRQELQLGKGQIAVTAGEGDGQIRLRLWVDAHRPVITLTARSDREVEMTAELQVWRGEQRQLTGGELFSAYGLSGAPHPVIVYPDTILEDEEDRIVWFHRNEHSMWAETLRVQGMAGWADEARDPLLGRTFGGIATGPGLEAVNARTLMSAEAGTEHELRIITHTAQTDTWEEWAREAEGLMGRAGAVGTDERLDEHHEWWRGFWERSWIRVEGPAVAQEITTNDLPLRIGADSNGENRFAGHMCRARLFGRALSPDEIRQLASGPSAEPPDPTGLIGDWRPAELAGGEVPNHAMEDLPAKLAGDGVTVEEIGGVAAVRFDGGGWLEVADDPRLDLETSVTLSAWVRPEQLPQRGGRILDKSRAGTSNGYLLDTYPGNSVRMILEPNTLSYDAHLASDSWTHVAATYDGPSGRQQLYIDGEPVALRTLGAGGEMVSQAYALQRFIAACAGRGNYPIKFNGSLFTVDAQLGGEQYDADYRRWGGPYWFQNTRLPYWPMLASGDTEMMLPLFNMYMEALGFAMGRTEVYFGHAGAFFPETMYFWGCYANDNYGWNREGKPPSHVDNTYIRHYYSGTLELLAMMLGYYAYTGDEGFARQVLVPFGTQILAFYDEHYPRDEEGKLLLKPAQALETWQKAVNPLPPIAGLRFALPRLLELPIAFTGEDRMERWQRLLGEVPDLPTREVDGETILAPAEEVLEGARNMENPELYAVFPYRIYGVGKPGLEIARRTFRQRRIKGCRGWQQDDTQAAYLGLAEAAQSLVAQRFANKHPGSRFPAFWGPNYDWIPDQDHGSNGLMALQTMLLQADGDRILLFPAWPNEWDVAFKLHGPQQTTVEGVYRDGEVRELIVRPEERRDDVIVVGPE